MQKIDSMDNQSNVSKEYQEDFEIEAVGSDANDSCYSKRTNPRKKDLLTEITTRKDAQKSGGFYKAHMSFYSHMRRMKKATT